MARTVRPELLKQFDLRGDSLEKKVEEYLEGDSLDNVEEILLDSIGDFEEDKIIVGTVVSVSADWVIVDVGYKAEGEVPKNHFEGARSMLETKSMSSSRKSMKLTAESCFPSAKRIASRAGNRWSTPTTRVTWSAAA